MQIEHISTDFCGKFECGENSKDYIDARTEDGNWVQDPSLYSGYVSSSPVCTEEILKALAEQDQAARKARKTFKRTVPRTTFADHHYDDHYWWAY
ncbi:hypothetical protein [Ruegeria arenilitoris]|uniref:hypothetical protein n=1 Tax=Ruegeria arenilitoris TaxID=1173585 RepID=UPI00147AA748|nr:hypothetical protein [Ruegeria arenilitoris]